jgi:hypothetical protein
MATIKLVTNILTSFEQNSGRFSCLLIGATRTPEKTIEAKNVAQIGFALDSFASELIAEGKPYVVSAIVAKGSRAPAGFNAATHKLRRFVNTQLVAAV